MINRAAALSKIAPIAKENQMLYQVLRDLIIELTVEEEEVPVARRGTRFRDAWE